MSIDRLQKAEIEYIKTFKTNFPRALFVGYSDDEEADLMEQCVKEHKSAEKLTGRGSDPFIQY